MTSNQLLTNGRVCKFRRVRLLALDGSPHRRGIVYKLAIMTPRKPNSAKRKIAKIKLIYNRRRVFASIPGIGHNLHEYSMVMIRGGSAKDLPGVNYALMRGLLDFLPKEDFIRTQRRSKFGVKRTKQI